MVAIVCGDSNSTGYDAHALHDPFSYTQCVSTARSVAMHQQLMASSSFVAEEDGSNSTTQLQHSAHIHDIGDIDKAYVCITITDWRLICSVQSCWLMQMEFQQEIVGRS